MCWVSPGTALLSERGDEVLSEELDGFPCCGCAGRRTYNSGFAEGLPDHVLRRAQAAPHPGLSHTHVSRGLPSSLNTSMI